MPMWLVFALVLQLAVVDNGVALLSVNEARQELNNLMNCTLNTNKVGKTIELILGETLAQLFGGTPTETELDLARTPARLAVQASTLRGMDANAIQQLAAKFFDSAISCVSGGQDNSDCCSAAGVPEACLRFCGKTDGSNLAANALPECQQHQQAVLLCHDENQPKTDDGEPTRKLVRFMADKIRAKKNGTGVVAFSSSDSCSGQNFACEAARHACDLLEWIPITGPSQAAACRLGLGSICVIVDVAEGC